MFLGPDSYLSTLSNMIAAESSLDVAVAFWGEGGDAFIFQQLSMPLRIICNLRSGGSNPFVIKKLLARAGCDPQVQVRQCDRLHAKVVVGRSQAIIGSANISKNGLGLEGAEVAHWLEAGIRTTAPEEVRSAQKWFDQLWDSPEVRTITQPDLAQAVIAWKRNRGGRPDYNATESFELGRYRPFELRDRNAFALIYEARTSESGRTAAAQHEQLEAQCVGGKVRSAKQPKHWPFEGWPDRLDTTDRNEYLCLFKAPKRPLVVDGVCKMIGTRVEVTYPDQDEPGWVDLARPIDTLLEQRFDAPERKELARQLRGLYPDIIDQAEELGPGIWRIHLSDLAAVWAAKSQPLAAPC